MAEREIRIFGDPILSQPTEQIEHVDAGVRELVKDLLDTVMLPGRAGVAAPQIGVGRAAFSYNVDGEIGYLLNPRIISTSGEPVEIEEGCLSVPDLWFPTPRYPEVVAEGIDVDGKSITIHGEGLMAQALQHEIDHLHGKVYIRRLAPAVRKRAMQTIRQSEWF